MNTTVFVTLTHISCSECGAAFGVEASFERARREDHSTFYCPNGHRQHFPHQTEKERRIAELEREAKSLKSSRDFWSEQSRSARQDAEHERRRVNGYRGVVARTKRRIAVGRCVCCSRQFKDLERHMKSQHPKFDPDMGAAALAEKA